MLILGFTLLLTAVGIAVMPCWRYSAAWGYWPGICVGILLVGIGGIAAGGRFGPSDALAERLAAQPKIEPKSEASIAGPALPPKIFLGNSGSTNIVSAEE